LILKSCSEKRRIELLYAWAFHEAPPREKSAHARPRKRSIATLVKRAEKTGRSVSSVTMPDGTTLNFGEPEPADAENPWLADLRKATKQ
jgi:hypothetical protein